MTLILAYQSRGITRDITLLDADGETITPSGDDKVRVAIGRVGETAKLTVTSGTPTSNGSSVTLGAACRVRLDAADLTFDSGTYTFTVEYYDSGDTNEWKVVEREVFQLDGVEMAEVLLELGLCDSATDEERALVSDAVVRAKGAVRRFLRYNPESSTHTEYYPQGEMNVAGGAGVWEVSDTQAYFRELAGAATQQLQLRNLPVRGITSLWVDYDGRSGARSGSFGDESLKTSGTDYWANWDKVDSLGNKICSDGIVRSEGAWPNSPGSVKVTYTAGYTSAELYGQDTVIDASGIGETIVQEAVRRARRALVLKKHSRAGHLPGVVTSESLGDYSYSIDTSQVERLVGGGDLTPDSKERLAPFVNWGIDL